ncbi:serpin family protein [Streptomyces tateyamensis]|uniref:Serpin family protein n=1 Tax=Streptomyces tateyamensis TaxID=565073 RepID=A0A2V4MX45_9ACTN|nr:serpin family protein [Streptomyces tateyamensis]PYC74469.1 serpin family protein [Streptomyces tateyamensis]
MRIRRSRRAAGAAAVALAVTAAVLAGCGRGGGAAGAGTGELKLAGAPVLTSTDQQRTATAGADQVFGLDLYRALAATHGDNNLVLSPSGLTTLLALVLPGARGSTAQELTAALHTELTPEQYAAATGELDRGARTGLDGKAALEQSDTLWAQQGLPVQQDYLAVLAGAFDAGVRTTDFAKDPEGARKAVNALVEQQTHGQVKDLFGPGAVQPSTLLALTDALYLKADWAQPFKPAQTGPREFHTLAGRTEQPPTMAQEGRLRYAAGSGGITGQPWQAVELPYASGHLAMDLLVPAQGGFDAFRRGLDQAQLQRITAGLADTEVDLTLPKFAFETDSNLNDPLVQLGMRTAFTPSADLTGIAGHDAPWRVRLTTVVQKARITVDEQGTVAAAGSGAVAGVSAAAPAATRTELHIDRPFLFLIRDTGTGLPLFLGQVTDPAAG